MRLWPKSKQINLVLGGGGAKGLGLVGALAALERRGYQPECIAGCSVGAIVGALTASGLPAARLYAMMDELDLTAFWDNPLAERLGAVAKGVSVMTRKGVHSGDKLQEWVEETLRSQGVETFGDLRMDHFGRYPAGYGYRLVVIAADITEGRLLRLPWDYPALGLDPDRQPVAEALRAATALPFYYRPYEIAGHRVVDGGLITSYPLSIFHSLDFQFSRRETIGIQLSLKPELRRVAEAGAGPLGVAKAMVLTAMNVQNEASLTDPHIRRNTILVDTGDVTVTDFGMTKGQRQRLYNNGYAAAETFLRRH